MSNRQLPRTLTDSEQVRLLRVTRDHRDGFRDHIIYALAIGTGLREHEIIALNVGDIAELVGTKFRIRRRVSLRVFKRSAKSGVVQQVFLPDALIYKLGRFLNWKRRKGEGITVDAPLFLSRRNIRISDRTLRHNFGLWQTRARFDRLHNFHALRHTALTNAYRLSRDIRMVQRIARHKSITSTTIYAAPSDEDVLSLVRELPC